MRLDLCTWEEVETYLESSKGIIIPIGSMEQHGPVGFIGTDALCAEAVARSVGEKTGAMVASVINVGMAQHHLGFAGSITLRPTTLMAVIRDIVGSLAHHGFNKFMFVNGHGGNIATMQAAFSDMYADQSLGGGMGGNMPRIHCEIANWWSGKAIADMSREAFGDKEGHHATISEVSLTYHLFPEDARRVMREDLDPHQAPAGSFTDAQNYRETFPDGRIASAPTLATLEMGSKMLEVSTAEISKKYTAMMEK